MPETLRLPEDCILVLGKEMEIFFLKNNREYIFKKEYEDYRDPKTGFAVKKVYLKPRVCITTDNTLACEFECKDLSKYSSQLTLLAKGKKVPVLSRGDWIDLKDSGIIIVLAITPKKIALLWVFNQLTADHYLRLAKAQAKKEKAKGI